MGKAEGLDRYLSFGVRKLWVTQYLGKLEDFWNSKENDLGSQKMRALKAFLLDSNLRYEYKISKNDSSDIRIKKEKQKAATDATVGAIKKIGLDNVISWATLLVNLSYTNQFGWYVKNIEFNKEYTNKYLEEMLSYVVEGKSNEHMVSAFKIIFIKTPIGKEIGLGVCDFTEKTNRNGQETITLNSITRIPWQNPDPTVILYSLYKFAEACGDYYQFTLSRLLNHEIDSDGISPTLIFGTDKEIMTKVLSGLSVNYPDFISVGFTHNLDNITLSREKTSTDVLELFYKEVYKK